MAKRQYLKILPPESVYALVLIAEVNRTMPEIIKRAYEDKFIEIVGTEFAFQNALRYMSENGLVIFDRIPGTQAAGFLKLYKITPRGKIAMENAIEAYCIVIDQLNKIVNLPEGTQEVSKGGS